MASIAPETRPDGRPFTSLQKALNPYLLKALEAMKFTAMSPVQERVLTELPSYTTDCLVQAKTGTGKTCAFLLPILHTLLSDNTLLNQQVRALIITPTRELALQIKKECDQLTSQLPRNRALECHTAFGGTARASALSKFLSGSPTILVATPGRLKDYLSEYQVAARFEGLRTLVLDEADTMLEAGFLGDVRQILKMIPPKSGPNPWQGMCFSATVPEKVKDVINCVLGTNYTALSTVSKTEVPTIDKVPQFHIIYPDHTKMFIVMYALFERICNVDSKIIVFGITANLVALYARVFEKLLTKIKVFELHSRLSQGARTRTTEQFKAAKTGIIFASDVIGRGMDFPNVDMVLQVGLPTSVEQYIHRVGRTGRAGKGGSAILMLTQSESSFLTHARQLPIQVYPDTQALTVLRSPDADRLGTVMSNIDSTVKQRAYSAFIGFFAGSGFLRIIKETKAGLVQIANDWAIEALLCDEPPPMEAKTIGKMGLKGVPGFNIGSAASKKAAKGRDSSGKSNIARGHDQPRKLPATHSHDDFAGQIHRPPADHSGPHVNKKARHQADGSIRGQAGGRGRGGSSRGEAGRGGSGRGGFGRGGSMRGGRGQDGGPQAFGRGGSNGTYGGTGADGDGW